MQRPLRIGVATLDADLTADQALVLLLAVILDELVLLLNDVPVSTTGSPLLAPMTLPRWDGHHGHELAPQRPADPYLNKKLQAHRPSRPNAEHDRAP